MTPDALTWMPLTFSPFEARRDVRDDAAGLVRVVEQMERRIERAVVEYPAQQQMVDTVLQCGRREHGRATDRIECQNRLRHGTAGNVDRDQPAERETVVLAAVGIAGTDQHVAERRTRRRIDDMPAGADRDRGRAIGREATDARGAAGGERRIEIAGCLRVEARRRDRQDHRDPRIRKENVIDRYSKDVAAATPRSSLGAHLGVGQPHLLIRNLSAISPQHDICAMD